MRRADTSATTESLPPEVTLHLLDFLDAVSLSKCAQTHSVWRRLASTDLLWHRLCKTEFGMDGGKADYTSRWQQERLHALGNLTLYIDFLDEIFFALAAFFALVSVSVVFPALLVLKMDGWLAISWTQVLGSIYGPSFLAVMFVLVRVTFALTLLSPLSSLSQSVNYCGIVQIAKRAVANRDVIYKFAVLIGPPATFVLAALIVQLECFYTPRLAIIIVWIWSGLAVWHTWLPNQIKRHAYAGAHVLSAFGASSLLLAKVMVSASLPWTAIVSPLTAPACFKLKQSFIHLSSRKRLSARANANHLSLRSLASEEGIRWSVVYYQHNHPLVSLALLALKLDGYLSAPWTIVLIDYILWVTCGPVATLARRLIHIMFREMPIPAKLRKL